MTEPDSDDGMVVARIVIERRISDDGDIVWSQATDGTDSEDNGLDLLTTLGMLRMAEDTAIRDAMGEIPDA